MVSGYGVTKKGNRRMVTNKLQYLRLPVVDQEICLNSINTAREVRDGLPHLTSNMFCAGTPEGGKDSCQGDSGGPFTFSEHGRFWVAGIVSWGVECGLSKTYGVYTKVTNYLDWIDKTMQEN